MNEQAAITNHPIHPWYGPCDGFADGECAECTETAKQVNGRIARLEAALRQIAEMEIQHTTCLDNQMRDIARAALDPTPARVGEEG